MISWPWDSVVTGFGDNGFPIYDRSYKAEQLRAIILKVFSEGVFSEQPDAFTTSAGEGMSVIVSPGTGHIRGDICIEESNREIVFTAASSQPRIDTVVLRWNANIEARNIDLYVKTGVASEVPSRPTLTRAETIWELGICDVFIPAGSTSISASRITDTRLETARCGIVTPFSTIDTSTFFNQIQAVVSERNAYLKKESDRIIKELETSSDEQIRELQASTDKAVQLAKDLIDETFAGNILKMLEDIAKEHTLYTTIDDSVSDTIDDSEEEPLTGALVFRTARIKEN